MSKVARFLSQGLTAEARKPNPELKESPWWRSLFVSYDHASLTFFRIGFGLMVLFEIFILLRRRLIAAQWLDPAFHFTYFGFSWVSPLPNPGMVIMFIVLGLAALGMVLGWYYRITSTLVFVCLTYLFLLEQTLYLNHFYLICLISFLMIFLPANRGYSMDVRRKRVAYDPGVPAWSVWLLRFQLGIVYFYAGIAKFNFDWLSGRSMGLMLGNRTHMPVVGPLFDESWFVLVMAYGGLLLDLLIVFFLVWRKTRLWAYLLTVGFHLSNSWMFVIGIFPWFMIFATLIYFHPRWPRRWFAKKKRKSKKKGKAQAVEPPEDPPFGRRQVWIASLLAAFVAMQMLVPLRHHFYPGDVAWNEGGHRFSWRMKLRIKRADPIPEFTAYDPDSDQRWAVNLNRYFKIWQIRRMATRPDQVLQAAHHIAKDLRDKGFPGVQIYVNSMVSLNGRPYQPLINPDIDLAAQPRTLAPVSWVLPFKR